MRAREATLATNMQVYSATRTAPGSAAATRTPTDCPAILPEEPRPEHGHLAQLEEVARELTTSSTDVNWMKPCESSAGLLRRRVRPRPEPPVRLQTGPVHVGRVASCPMKTRLVSSAAWLSPAPGAWSHSLTTHTATPERTPGTCSRREHPDRRMGHLAESSPASWLLSGTAPILLEEASALDTLPRCSALS